MRYVKFVVEASYWAPRYVGKVTLYLQDDCQSGSVSNGIHNGIPIVSVRRQKGVVRSAQQRIDEV